LALNPPQIRPCVSQPVGTARTSLAGRPARHSRRPQPAPAPCVDFRHRLISSIHGESQCGVRTVRQPSAGPRLDQRPRTDIRSGGGAGLSFRRRSPVLPLLIFPFPPFFFSNLYEIKFPAVERARTSDLFRPTTRCTSGRTYVWSSTILDDATEADMAWVVA